MLYSVECISRGTGGVEPRDKWSFAKHKDQMLYVVNDALDPPLYASKWNSNNNGTFSGSLIC
jgi:hypothetical protein